MLWPIGIHLGAEARAEVVQLETQHAENDSLWQALNQLTFDSWSEKRLMVRLLSSSHLMTVAPRQVGCSAQVVSGRTGRDLGDVAQPALVLQSQDLSAVIWPQATVQIGSSHRRCDFLVVVAMGDIKRTLCLEVVSPETHPDASRDQARAEHLGLRVGRLWVEHLGRPDLLERLFQWLADTLRQTTPPAPSSR